MDAKEYVGMEWERDLKEGTSQLHQSAFCEKILKDFGYRSFHNSYNNQERSICKQVVAQMG